MTKYAHNKCPECGCKEGFELREIPNSFFVCCNCLALVQITPFGCTVMVKDATKRFPEIVRYPEIQEVLRKKNV